MNRRRILWIALCSIAVAPLVSGDELADEHHRRADAATESFLLKFWRQSQNYLRDVYPGQGTTGYWTFAQGLDAILDAVERTEGARFYHFIQVLYQAQDIRGWFPGWYDDEFWMTLALLRAHELTGEARYLATAEALYADIQSGWDETCCGDTPGGIWWDKAHSQKATASNAGPVIAGVRLARVTGETSYLEFARRVYDFWLENMVDPETYQVTDHINPDGTKTHWRFTYNEGLMIGAGVELFRATGDEVYLETSRRIAAFMLEEEVDPSPLGSPGGVLSDGDASSCTGDCHAFKGPAYRFLAELYEETGDALYHDTLARSAEAIWELARSPDTLFAVDWTGPPPSSASEPQMCAALIALNIFGRLSGPYEIPPSRPDRYEAEDAELHAVGLEAKFGSFSGWGYVAGWIGDGQRVVFHVSVPQAGPYRLQFRYSAEAGYCNRTISINETVVEPNFSFRGTPSWESYTTMDLVYDLPAGDSTISVTFLSNLGSFNYLNLDYLEVTPLGTVFERGDASPDGQLDVSDAITILSYLFLGEPVQLPCSKSGDADDGGSVEMTDAIYILRYLFLGTAPPPQPFGGCGLDPTDDLLGCERFPPCEGG